MNCHNCGAPLEAGARFCEVCGSPVAASTNANTGAPAGTPGTGVNANPTGYAAPASNAYAGANAYQSPASNQYSNYGAGNNNGDFNVNQGFNTKAIRKWFKGEAGGILWSILLIIIGIPFIPIGVGVIMIVIGTIRLISAFGVKDSRIVDEAWNTYVNILSNRGMDKLNLIEEQVNLIEPVVLVGAGASPDGTFALARDSVSKKGIGFKVLAKIFSRRKKNGTELDPYEAKRIGKDNILRSMLMEVTVFRFSEEQLLVYTGNIDISTGIIYDEDTKELFSKIASAS